MRERILVVDDEADVSELLRFHLTRRGYEVLTASNGLEALNLARRHLPAVVVLDLKMDGMDGYTVCEILRQQPPTANIHIIMLTGLSGQLTRLNGLGAGADDFVNKPFEVKHLLQRIAAAVEAHEIRQQKLPARAETARA